MPPDPLEGQNNSPRRFTAGKMFFFGSGTAPTHKILATALKINVISDIHPKKNSRFLRPQSLRRLLLFSTCFILARDEKTT